jgi:predicted transcriptional regulator
MVSTDAFISEGFTATEVGRYIGISTPAVSQSMQKRETLLKKYKLNKLIN